MKKEDEDYCQVRISPIRARIPHQSVLAESSSKTRSNATRAATSQRRLSADIPWTLPLEYIIAEHCVITKSLLRQ